MLFDRSQLKLKPLSDRSHELDINIIKRLLPVRVCHDNLYKVASCIIDAKRRRRAIILMMGAHVIRSGVQRYIIDLMERGYVTADKTSLKRRCFLNALH